MRRQMILLDEKNCIIFAKYSDYVLQINNPGQDIRRNLSGITFNEALNQTERVNKENTFKDIMDEIANDPDFYLGENEEPIVVQERHEEEKDISINNQITNEIQEGDKFSETSANDNIINKIDLDEFKEFYEDF